MKKKLIKIALVSLVLLSLIFPQISFWQRENQILAEEEIEEPFFEEPEFPMELSMPGRVEGTGKFFEIKDSKYLNVKLQSEKEIKVILESIPKMISIDISSSTVEFTKLTLSGLEPNKTYYKYQDSYKNEVVFVSDENGSYSWQQDLTKPHHIWFQEINGTIFIPQDCPKYGIWDEEKRICTLTQNLNESVMINVSHITLDCNGYSIIGTGTGKGVYISGSNVTVKNCLIKEFGYGIYFYYFLSNNTISENKIINNYTGIWVWASNYNTLSGNKIMNNKKGIWLYNSSNNVLRNNDMSDNSYNFCIEGLKLSYFMNDIDVSNKINGKPMYYLIKKENLIISSSTHPEVGYLTLIDSTDIVVEGLELKNNGQGILFVNSENILISQNKITNNLQGITVINSSNNFISGNKITDNLGLGILLFKSSNNTIFGNNITNTSKGGGIHLRDSNYNTISENEIKNNWWIGIQLWSSSNNIVSKNITMGNTMGIRFFGLSNYNTASGNKITDNHKGIAVNYSWYNIISENSIRNNGRGIHLKSSYHNAIFRNEITNNSLGVFLDGSSSNAVYHNNFIDNKIQAFSYGWKVVNAWDDGYPSGGNYWSDYRWMDWRSGPNQDQPGSDGIGDSPYCFYGGCDRYPFMRKSGWEKPIENLPPVCKIELRKKGTTSKIDKIEIGEFFDIYVGNSTDDTGIKEVRFSSDDSQDGNPQGEWTRWYNWEESLEDWNAQNKIKAWSFATAGKKEVWVQLKDEIGQTSECSANIEAIPWSFAVITDLHIGWGIPDYDDESYYDSTAGQDYYLTKRLEKTIEWINKNYKNPDYNIKFVVVTGDISDTAEYSEFLKAREILNKLEIPYIPVIGNHDIWPYTQKINSDPDGIGGRWNTILRQRWEEYLAEKKMCHLLPSPVLVQQCLKEAEKLKKEEPLGDEYFEKVFWQNNPENVQKLKELFGKLERQEEFKEHKGPPYFQNYAFNYKGVDFIVLDFTARDHEELIPPGCTSVRVWNETVDWLKEKLKERKGKKVVVFVHQPITGKPPFYFPYLSKITELFDKYCQCFPEECNCKVFHLAGHVHWNRIKREYTVIKNEYTLIETEALLQSEVPGIVREIGAEPAPSGRFLRLAQITGNEIKDINYDTFATGFPPAINPYFTVNPVDVAINEKITFRAYSKNLKPEEILSYEWDFVKEIISYEGEPGGTIYKSWCEYPKEKYSKCEVIYYQPGTYKVSLKITPKSDPNYSEELSWNLKVKKKAKPRWKIYLPFPGIVPLLHGIEDVDLTKQANAQNTTEWVMIGKVASPVKPIGAFEVHFDKVTEDINLSNLVAGVDLKKKKSILYMEKWPEAIERQKILFIPK